MQTARLVQIHLCIWGLLYRWHFIPLELECNPLWVCTAICAGDPNSCKGRWWWIPGRNYVIYVIYVLQQEKNNEKHIIQVRLTDWLTFIDSAGSGGGGVRSLGPLQELYKSDRGLLLSVSRCFEMLRDVSSLQVAHLQRLHSDCLQGSGNDHRLSEFIFSWS